MPLTASTRLGTYEILGPLGAGGMGEVYRAKDTRLGREIALKVLPEAFARDAERLSRFEREARTVAGLNHPNIVTLFSVDDEDGVRFLTMELVDGQSLDHLVKPGGLPVARVLELGIALAEALVAAHEKGVVHRDLKPANVMLTREGRVKVLDFGLAKLAEAAPALDVSQAATLALPLSTPGQVVGTVPYMAPEQIRGETVDARTDLFALGIMLYELAAGRRPFGGTSPADVSAAILRDLPVPIQSVRPDVPRDLGKVIGRCLEKDPRDRTQTARDVYNELRYAWRELERAAVGPAAGVMPVAAPSAPESSASPPTSASMPPPALSSMPAPASTPSSGIPQGMHSIAVLPFVNRSRDEEDEYFSDGLAEEILNVLTKIRGLRVTAHASSFKFKGKNEDLEVIGQKLNVATILDGSVRKLGNRVRIAVRLVKMPDGYQLWSETYDRTLEDIFAVQDDIAQSVVKELRATLLGKEADSKTSGELRAEVAAAAKGRSSDAEAQRLYLLARHLIDRRTREEAAKGIEYLKETLERDPGYALAWVELSRAYSSQENFGWIPMAEGRALAREAAKRALELGPDMAEAHARMGKIQRSYDWDWRAAEASYARALELEPRNAGALLGAALMAGTMGRSEEQIRLTRRALEQDPLSVAAYHNLGIALRAADRHAESEAACRKALELAPQLGFARTGLASALFAQGRLEEAFAETMRVPLEFWRLLALAILHHAAGRAPESDQAVRELTEKYSEYGPAPIAEAHAMRGETDAAFEWLERAYAQRDAGLTEIKLNLHLRSLHADPRWSAFLKKMGLAD